MKNENKCESLFWSIALPGFSQILNGKFLKGLLFIGLEFLINVQSNYNDIILLSFNGNIKEAIQTTDYGWLMFYPCLYFFAMWDAYKDAGGGQQPYSFLPFAFTAFWVTIGVIYSSSFTLFGELPGPVWLPMLSVIPGVGTGRLIQWIVRKSRG